MPTEKKENPATKKMPEDKKYAQHTSDDRDVHHTQMPGKKTGNEPIDPNRDPMKRERTDRDDDRRR